jgi:hypothetical protein
MAASHIPSLRRMTLPILVASLSFRAAQMRVTEADSTRRDIRQPFYLMPGTNAIPVS